MSFFKKLFGGKKTEDTPIEQELKEEQRVDVGATDELEEQEETETLETEEEVEEELSEEEEQLAEDEIKQEILEEATKLAKEESAIDESAQEAVEVPEVSVEVLPVSNEQNIEEDDTVLELEAQEETEIAEDEAIGEEKQKGFIKRLFSGLSKTRDSILKGVDDVLSNFRQIDEELYEELEEALIMADFGVDTTLHIMDKLKACVKEEKITDPKTLNQR